jgi:hypothetical protein
MMMKSGLGKIFLKFLHALTMSFLLLNFDQKHKFSNKHNMNLAVLMFFKTYVCKHESKHERKHIELKPTQKNWPSKCDFINTMSLFFSYKPSSIFALLWGKRRDLRSNFVTIRRSQLLF